jgi:hypothetical protein
MYFTVIFKSILFTGIALFGLINKVHSVCYSAANGYWNNAATWSCTGTPAAIGCGKTIHILAQHTITVNTQNNYMRCSSPIHIVVYGTLQFTNGNKLDLPCGSTFEIMPGAVVKKATAGGGNSTLVSICDYTWWNAGNSDQAGYQMWGAMPLPVELLDFSAVAFGSGVLLKWSTATEINNDYFELRRGNQEQGWQSIAVIEGAAFSAQLHRYNHIDYPETQGQLYYQLHQFDFNGATEHIGTTSIRLSINDWLLFPNPSSTNWNIIPDESLLNHVVVIRDNVGNVVPSAISISGGHVTIALAKHKPGLYFLTVSDDSGSIKYSGKLIAN